jgi:hypothetical protein
MKPNNNKRAEDAGMTPEEIEDMESADRRQFWSIDLETMLVPMDKKQAPLKFPRQLERGQLYEHRPILSGACNYWTGETLVWEDSDGIDAATKLIQHFLADLKKPAYLVSHNGAGFDHRFYYGALVEHFPPALKPRVVADGARLKKMTAGKLTFLDSMLHLKVPLAGLPAMFGFKGSKGHFPYTFLTEPNRGYAGPIPAIEWFEPDRKQPKQRQELIEWHAAESDRANLDLVLGGKGWVLMDELRRYFIPDLEIPAKAMCLYSDNCRKAGMSDPLGTITLPTNCLKTFLKHHLKPNQIPILRKFPTLCKRWEWNLFNEEKIARAAYHGGRTGNAAMYYCLTPEQIAAGWQMRFLDYNSMYPSVMVNHVYPTEGYEFKEFDWEDQPVLDEAKMADILSHEGFAMIEAYHPTGIMFPILNKTINDKLQFPLQGCLSVDEANHFHQYLFNKDPDQLAPCSRDCEVCHRCFDNTDGENYVYQPSVYTMPEIRCAIEQGYLITHVYFVLQATDSSSTLFNSYYASAYGIKCKYSDPPDLDWSDPAVCEEFRQGMFQSAGIEITEPNPRDWFAKPQDHIETPEEEAGRRSMKEIGKMSSNSMYGKFGSASNPYETVLVPVDPDKEAEYLDGRHGTLKSVYSHGALTAYTVHNEWTPSIGYKTTSVAHAAYVTGYANVKLTNCMNHIVWSGGKVLYYDTDSIIAVFPPGVNPPPTGPYLGDLSDEIKAGDGTLCEFVGLLPKTYCIRNTEGKVIKMRFKGISGLTGKGGDARNAEIITFDWMKDAALRLMHRNETTVTPVHHSIWAWNRPTGKVTTQDSWKFAKVDRSMFKGKLAADEYGTLYPLGAEKMEQWKNVVWN